MPAAEDKLVEKLPFDVYAMMLILSFLAVLGAILLLNDDLTKNWYQGQEGKEVSEYITQVNEQVGDNKNNEPQISEKDRRDYKLIIKDASIPSFKEYPEWLKPAKPVDPTPGKDNTDGVPQNVLDTLRNDYKDPVYTPDVEPSGTGGAPATPPAAAPEAPPAAPPAAPAPADAAKTEPAP